MTQSEIEAKKKTDIQDIVFVNYILDNVHGMIGLTAIENQIECLPIFKRLQDISQLGLVKRIFPGALHNRYTHSLGVMHVIDQMALHLKKFSTAERQLMRLAGMLHDLGHYPLSHDIEQVYNRPDLVSIGELSDDLKEKKDSICHTSVASIKKDINILIANKKGDDIEDIDYMPKPKRELVARARYHHEAVTARVIKSSDQIRKIIANGIKEGYFNDKEHIWNSPDVSKADIDDFASKIINDICALIQGNGDYDYRNAAFPQYFTAMMQMIHSELDADRIDYLLRDATFSGASYGNFDISILLQNLDMVRVKKFERDEKEVWIVGIKEKGIGCADQYMINRYLAYTQVIFNKYTSAIGKMLREVVLWMISKPSVGFYKNKDIDQIIKEHETDSAYLAFTDNYFFEKLNLIEGERFGCSKEILFFIDKLKRFRSLDLEAEDVFSGGLPNQKTHIESTEMYRKIMDGQIREDGLYLFSQKKLTNHTTYEKFKENFDRYNSTHSQKMEFEKYELDRMMDGLVVIYEDEEPELLIDASRSMLTEFCDLGQIYLRKYKMA